jgi:hypothetical protein
MSQDQGATFSLVLNRCCWGFDEDKAGNLFAGVYHEVRDPDAECALYWSRDGVTWADIAPAAWRTQTHVHHIAVDPNSGWLYANLGDVPDLRGCWRCKLEPIRVSRAAAHGSAVLALESATTLSAGDELVIWADKPQRTTVVNADGATAQIAAPLETDITEGATGLVVRWIMKVQSEGEPLQFAGLCFKEGFIYLADDNPPSRNAENVVVYRAHDDGSDTPAAPQPVLQAAPGSGWGAFFCELDSKGRIWTATRPLNGKGNVLVSEDGTTWRSAAQATPEDLPCWRGTHTFRDASIGQTGDGRFLTGPNAEVLVSYLNKSLLVTRLNRPSGG